MGNPLPSKQVALFGRQILEVSKHARIIVTWSVKINHTYMSLHKNHRNFVAISHISTLQNLRIPHVLKVMENLDKLTE